MNVYIGVLKNYYKIIVFYFNKLLIHVPWDRKNWFCAELLSITIGAQFFIMVLININVENSLDCLIFWTFFLFVFDANWIFFNIINVFNVN